jgi:uncharacterized protein GlcG (DUF336 family)
MKLLFATAALTAALAGPALAQGIIPSVDIPLYFVPSIPARIEGMPRQQPRSRGPSVADALALAAAVGEACKVGAIEPPSVLITDSTGVPVVLVSGDGSGERGQLVTFTKAAAVVRFKMSVDELSAKAKADPKLAQLIKVDPNIGALRGGGYPLKVGSEFIGALGVTNTSSDSMCAQKALAKVQMH